MQKEIDQILSYLQFSLIKHLKQNGSMRRKELANLLDTPRTTIYDNLKKLEDWDIVKRYKVNNGKKGRPKVYWKIKKNGDEK